MKGGAWDFIFEAMYGKPLARTARLTINTGPLSGMVFLGDSVTINYLHIKQPNAHLNQLLLQGGGICLKR